MTDVERITDTARLHEWSPIESRDPTMVSFGKVFQGYPARINVWFTTMTVGTYINHPKKGKTQLFRKWCSMSDVEKIFENPRWHSRKGYR